MGIGGIWIQKDYRDTLKENIKAIKASHSISGEMKWRKISPAYLEFYKKIINYYLNDANIRSRVIVIESSKINNIHFNQNDNELGFYKFYYQLLHHWILDYNIYEIFTDFKLIRKRLRLKVLKDVLSNLNLTSKIEQVQALPSEESIGIQLADLITGAVVSKFNNQLLSKAKKGIITLFETHLKRQIGPTIKGEEKLNVFKINLQGGW